MLDIGSVELLLVAMIALVVVGPRDLPKLLRTVGSFLAKARRMAGHFKSGLDTMVRESELEDMQKKWDAQNQEIMRRSNSDTAFSPPADAPGEEAGDSGAPTSDTDNPPGSPSTS